jgi:preprotein translocase subunit Sec61beta
MTGLRFEPMIVYAALAFAGVIALARVLLGWAMRD